MESNGIVINRIKTSIKVKGKEKRIKEEKERKEGEREQAKLQKGDLLCRTIPDTSEDNRLIFREKRIKVRRNGLYV